MIERKIGFIGAGVMAEALVRSLLEQEVCLARDVFASDPLKRRREVFAEMVGRNVHADNTKVAEAAEVLVLAVKPGVLPTVAEELAPVLRREHLVISIAPGITLDWLQQNLQTPRVVRVMPNSPLQVGEGAIAYSRGPKLTRSDKQVVEAVFSAVGMTMEVNERHMDAITGLSGSGPAYGFVAIEALADGGVKMGLPRTMATVLAAQTLLGAARMVLQTDQHAARLKDQVATPGGTTIEGLHELEKAGVRAAFINAVEAATRKSKQLGLEL